MGLILDDLYDHEGFADRRLADGRLAGGVWSHDTLDWTGYVAACGCGWRSPHQHPPTDQGWEAALKDWRVEHAVPLLERQADRRRQELARMLSWLGDQAGRLQDPTSLERVRRATDRAHQLVQDLQDTLERAAFEREADGAR
jgi:hypothetical protein